MRFAGFEVFGYWKLRVIFCFFSGGGDIVWKEVGLKRNSKVAVAVAV